MTGAHHMNFDTLKFAKKLIAAGYSQKQAEAQSEALRDVVDDGLETLATKGYVNNVKLELKHSIEQTKVELQQQINNVRTELKQEISDVKAELKQDIFDVKVGLEKLNTKLEKVVGNINAILKDNNKGLIKWMFTAAFSMSAVMGSFIGMYLHYMH